MVLLDDVDKNFAFDGADLHTVTSSSFCKSFSELLEFFFTASQEINVVSKPQVAEWSSQMDTDDSGMLVSSASSTALPAKQSFSDGC